MAGNVLGRACHPISARRFRMPSHLANTITSSPYIPAAQIMGQETDAVHGYGDAHDGCPGGGDRYPIRCAPPPPTPTQPLTPSLPTRRFIQTLQPPSSGSRVQCLACVRNMAGIATRRPLQGDSCPPSPLPAAVANGSGNGSSSGILLISDSTPWQTENATDSECLDDTTPLPEPVPQGAKPADVNFLHYERFEVCQAPVPLA